MNQLNYIAKITYNRAELGTELIAANAFNTLAFILTDVYKCTIPCQDVRESHDVGHVANYNGSIVSVQVFRQAK